MSYIQKKLRKMGLNFGERSLGYIAGGFAIVILLGSFLLSLPSAAISGESIGWFDALFESTSAVCVTGLVVRDTGTTFTLFGKIVLICLIQIGGLSFLTFTAFLFRILKRRITLAEKVMLRDGAGVDGIGDAASTFQWIIKTAFVIELSGAAVLAFRFIPMYGWIEGIGYSVFHSISAFCNAGFDLFGGYNSLTGFQSDVLVNLSVITIVVIGGIGFSVIREILDYPKKRRISAYVYIVLVTYFSLMVFGWLFTMLAEWNNPDTLGNLSTGEKILAALFQSMTLRTAGFNTIDEAALKPATKLVSCILMLIGCAPASTGGGIKVTTAAVIVLSVAATAKGRDTIVIRKNSISRDTVRRALSVLLISTLVLVINTVVISLMQPELDLMDVMFECSSAIGTVGISAFGSASLHTIPRILIIVSMFLGRIGPLSVAIILSKKGDSSVERIRYPEAHIMIG